ncbi:3-oxoacyl-[acyl-carrier protein] reductase [Hoyosella altamirensis]|uniref:3-oxoacyl-[acyl-carrier protein] reductase n=1 Tax=Hoyosella altamirensis TaxID=616997 RepID=A0A839RJ90_9ACTN|nr:3-oxoacyl-[acyl-carrier protein] reductase [Hoyosella altamirensis]
MSGRFEGKSAIVTGASRGIGLAIAQRLVKDGARVCVTARKQDALDEVVTQLGGPQKAIAVAGRADDIEHQSNAVKQTIETFGSVDMLINNAGINPVYGPMIDLNLDAARKTVEVNCLAAISWVQQAHLAWMGEHGGAIVNVASVAAIKPAPGIGFYGATKAMLKYITEELAVELGPHIRVNAVAPAVVKTQFATALYEGREENVAQAYPLKRLGILRTSVALRRSSYLTMLRG